MTASHMSGSGFPCAVLAGSWDERGVCLQQPMELSVPQISRKEINWFRALLALGVCLWTATTEEMMS